MIGLEGLDGALCAISCSRGRMKVLSFDIYLLLFYLLTSHLLIQSSVIRGGFMAY